MGDRYCIQRTENANYGIRMAGSGNILTPEKGVIWIDVGTNSLSSDDVLAIKKDLADYVPCYFRVVLGYMLNDVFTPYSNGTIG